MKNPFKNIPEPILIAAVGLVALAWSGCRGTPQPPADAEDFKIEAVISTNQVTVGDVFTLSLRAVHPAGSRMQASDPEHDKALVLRDRKWSEQELPDGRAWSELRYELVSFQVGTHLLSTGTVAFVDDNGVLKQIPFPDLSIRVDSVLAEGQDQPEDVKELLAWPKHRRARWIGSLLLVAVLSILAGLVALLLIKRPQQRTKPPPRIDPHAIARKALHNLLAKEWIEQGLPEPFYVELSSIVRRFLELKFALRAPEQTTEEFIRDAAASENLTREQQERVSGFLEQSDLVKFARFEPMPEDMRKAYRAAELLVEETRQAVSGGGAA